MSVIQRIRDKGAWIIFGVIALALIAFIAQDGLGRRGSLFGNSDVIGKVNGVAITRDDFNADLEKYSRGGDKTSIIPQLWNMKVEEVLYNEEYKRLGLTVSSKELADILYGPQSPLAQDQQFKDENGNFNVEAAKQAITNLKKSKDAKQIEAVNEQLIKPTVANALRNKYQAILQHSSYIPTWIVEKQKADNAAISSISYIYVPYSSIVDSTVKVTDEEIKNYIRKHPAGFEKEEETRSFSYVSFDANATKEDSAATLNTVLGYKNEFISTNDVKGYLNRVGTETPFLDGYVVKSQMKMPNADSIKNLGINQSFGPYLDGSNYVVAKMLEKKTIPDSVFCMHILVRVGAQQGGVDDSTAKKRIDSVAAVISAGADFKTVMEKVSDDKAATTQNNGVMKFNSVQIQSENFDQDFAKYILFDGKKGEKKVVKTKFGYHYIYITEQKDFSEAVKVAYLAKPITASKNTNTTAQTAALQFASSVKNKKEFDEAAAKLNKIVQPSQDLKENDYTIPNFGAANTRPLVRWVFENSVGTVGQPTDVNNTYIVPIITTVNEKGLMSVNEARPRVEMFVRNEKKAKQIMDTKLKSATSLEAYASAAGVAIQRADSLSFANPTIAGVGYEPKISGAAFNTSLKGKVSDVIAANNGVIVLRVENIGAKAVDTNDESIRQNLLQGQRMAAYSSSNALRKSASIKDLRFKNYQ